MRISCPFCGERDHSEFTYLGDAAYRRPDQDGDFVDAVYLRDNPAGGIEELWYHGAGCRRWLKVARDTRTHAISSVGFARPEPVLREPALREPG